jgi:DNA polymerase III epsilon subunit
MNNERIIFLDTETTGLSPRTANNRVIEIACIEYIAGKPTGIEINSILFADGKKSTKGALSVHGIKEIDREKSPSFKDLSHSLLSLLKDAHLVIYNKDFDIEFIESEFNYLNQKISLQHHCSKITCAMALSQKVMKVPRISLDNACKRYGIDITHRVIHGAKLDAELTAKLYFKLIDDSIKPLERTPQEKKHKENKTIPIPRAFKHPITGAIVQLNFCKNADCENFGIPAKNPKKEQIGKIRQTLGNNYKLNYVPKSDTYLLHCKLCKTSSSLINNRAFVQESIRVKNIGQPIEPSCKNKACKNSDKGIYNYPDEYKKNGFTRKTKFWAVPVIKKGTRNSKPKTELNMQPMYGSQRFLCKSCKTSLTVPLDPQQRHYRRDINEVLYLEFVNKGIINRLIDKYDINPQTVYGKINFFYEQSLLFSRYHEMNLQKQLSSYIPVLSCDHQYYLSNWGDTNTPMPTRISNLSTVDNITDYVLTSTINFDFKSNSEYVKSEYKRKKEGSKRNYYRRFAQYVLSDKDIENDATNPDKIPLQAPSQGLLVFQSYSALAHFDKVKSLLQDCEQFVYFLDNDSGFKQHFPAIFHKEITKSKPYAYLLSSDKNGGADLLDAGMAEELKSRFDEVKRENPALGDKAIWQKMWKMQFDRPVTKAKQKSEWIINPNIHSRYVGVQPISQNTPESIEHASVILQSLSLNGVDNWFQILRRLVNMLERPITSATNSKKWNAYAGYNPAWMSKLIEIMRVYNNFCRTNEKSLKIKKSAEKPSTPAQRMGIADKVFTAQDILSFSYHKEFSDNLPTHISML